jgi:hypothetical protein
MIDSRALEQQEGVGEVALGFEVKRQQLRQELEEVADLHVCCYSHRV